jgi:hypothetical protein
MHNKKTGKIKTGRIFKTNKLVVPEKFNKKRIEFLKNQFLKKIEKYFKGASSLRGIIPSKGNDLLIHTWKKNGEIFRARLYFTELEGELGFRGIISKTRKNSKEIKKETKDLEEIVFNYFYSLNVY